MNLRCLNYMDLVDQILFSHRKRVTALFHVISQCHHYKHWRWCYFSRHASSLDHKPFLCRDISHRITRSESEKIRLSMLKQGMHCIDWDHLLTLLFKVKTRVS